MDWKRFFRALVCLLVVCCLLLNMAPVRAQAVAVADDIAIGVIAMLILMAAGVVFHPQTAADITAIGNSFQNSMYQWGTGAEKLDEVEEWFGGLTIYDGGSDEDGDGEEDTLHQRQVSIARGLLGGITAWIASVIAAGVSYEKAVSYECSLALPEWDVDAYPYFFLVVSPTLTLGPTYYLYISDTPAVQYDSYPALNIRVVDLVSENCTYSDSPGWGAFSTGYCRWANSESLSNCYEYVRYSNYDIYDSSGALYFEANVSEVKYNTLILTTEALLGDVAPSIQEGTATESDIVIPEIIDYSQLVPIGTTAQDAVIDTAQQLDGVTLTYEEYLDLIGVADDSDTEDDPSSATDPSVSPDTGSADLSGPVAEVSASTFIDALVDALAAPFEWLAETLLEGIRAIFVPSEDFLSEKVESLRSEFSFADSIISAGELVGGTLQSLETEPPVIYIDLGAARGSYYLGGVEPFIDLRWYAEYKPTGDALISALLWIAFIWRLFIKLPGIISGMPGDFVMDGLHQIGLADRLPARSAAYEVQRINNRQSLRKGPGK